MVKMGHYSMLRQPHIGLGSRIALLTGLHPLLWRARPVLNHRSCVYVWGIYKELHIFPRSSLSISDQDHSPNHPHTSKTFSKAQPTSFRRFICKAPEYVDLYHRSSLPLRNCCLYRSSSRRRSPVQSPDHIHFQNYAVHLECPD